MTNPTEQQPIIRRQTWFWLALIVLAAGLMRFIQLDIAPVGGHGDVAWIGINALDWIDRGAFPYYVWHLYAPEPMVVQLNALSIPFFGATYLSPRMVTAVFGLFLVILLFPATWWLLDGIDSKQRERAALLASAAAALSMHAAYISRLGMRAALFPALVALVIWLTVWAWRRGGYLRWALAGTSLALMQYAYIPARLFPLILALWFIHGFWADRDRWKKCWRGWVVMAVVSAILTLPNLITFATTPEAFTARADSGGAETGGWAWQYDPEGGVGSVMLQKIGLELLALGIEWNGPYSVMNQPMLGAIFFIGFLIAMGLLIKQPKQIALAWVAIGIPIMFLTDLISGAVVEIHAVRQTGVLPFVYILAGIGLAQGISWLENFWADRNSSLLRYISIGVVILAILPAGIGMARYLGDEIPAQYADPNTSWRDQQMDVDIGNRILSQPESSYLLPYDEYTRSNIAWLTMDAYRQRQSGINSEGMLAIANPPEEITVIITADPYRIRHDGRESRWDMRLWVLLHDGVTYLLPPITDEQQSDLFAQVESTEPEILIDRSDTEIAQFTAIDTPNDLFAEPSVITSPVDVTFSTNNSPEAKIVGYSLPFDETDEVYDLVAGETITITFYWQAQRELMGDYEVFAQIWNENGEVITAAHDYPFSGMYRTRLWQTDEIVASYHWVTLPDELPTGRYSLVAGFFTILGDETLAVSGEDIVLENGAMIARDLRVTPEMAVVDSPSDLSLQFGDTLNVANLEVTRNGEPLTFDETWDVQAGDTLTFDIVWEALGRPTLDYSLFLHLLDDPAAPPLAQADLSLGASSLPSGIWREGDLWRGTVTLTIPDTLEAGEYSLWMGTYFYADGSRLTPLLDGEEQSDGRVMIGSIQLSDE